MANRRAPDGLVSDLLCLAHLLGFAFCSCSKSIAWLMIGTQAESRPRKIEAIRRPETHPPHAYLTTRGRGGSLV